MKRTIIIFLIISICVALFACNRTENNESSDAPKKEGTSVADDSSAEESVAVDESSEIPADAENIPASQLMSMDKNSIVAYAESLIAMINRNTTEIPDDFFYPASDDDLPSPDNPYFSDILSGMNYCMETVKEYGVYHCSDVVYTNAKIAAMKEDLARCNLYCEKYKQYYEDADYDNARFILANLSQIYHRFIFEETENSAINIVRNMTNDYGLFGDFIEYHPERFRFSPYRNYVENVKNSDLSREAIRWVYGFSSYTDRLGDGYAGAIYPYGVLSVCRYPRSHDVLDDHIMIETTLPIYRMNVQSTAGQTTIPIDPDAVGVNPAHFRVRPNCAFDSAEILPIDEENEEVTFVLYDENGDEIKRITFNYMTYVFRETYPA